MLDTTPWETPLRPLEFQQVRRAPEEPLFNYLVARYHPLGYTRPVGEHLKYLVYAGGRPIPCLAWSSAPRHLGPRDRFIGWSAEVRRRNLRFLAYNPRYPRSASGVAHAGSDGPSNRGRLGAPLRAPDLFSLRPLIYAADPGMHANLNHDLHNCQGVEAGLERYLFFFVT
jgi:hypothetical protein